MISKDQALILIDIQYDFLEDGSLAVPFASEIFSPILKLAPSFETIVASQDWHPKGHSSFASSHPGKNQFEKISIKGEDQILWPDHCVQNSWGAKIHPDILQLNPSVIIQKGTDPDLDSYSVFFDNHHAKKTYLDEWLKTKEINRLVFAGLATDYCVLFSVLDALKLGYEVHIFAEGCRGVNQNKTDSEEAIKKMLEKGAHLLPNQIQEKALKLP